MALGVATRFHGIVGIQSRTEVPMKTQPPEDLSALKRLINEQVNKIAALEQLVTTEFAEIKQSLCDLDRGITHLTDSLHSSYSGSYSGEDSNRSQEQAGDQMQIAESQQHYSGKDKDNPPIVPLGTLLTCVRCGHQWTTRKERPKKCPECVTPWWFPPRWRWHQSQTQSQQ